MKEMTLQEAKKYKENYPMTLTVGELKKFLEDISDDALVYMERIEDMYFDENGWDTIKKDHYFIDVNNKKHLISEHNYFIASGAIQHIDDEHVYIMGHY